MPLVIRPKEEQAVIVRHCGETLVVRVNAVRGNAVRICLDGPDSFEFRREEQVGGREYVEPKP